MEKRICSSCGREELAKCELGEMYYLDGSSIVCPNWEKKLLEIEGIPKKDVEHEYWYRRRFD